MIEDGEGIRFQCITSRECMMRITKTHLYRDVKLRDMFKVWAWAVGACNDGSL